jgi:lysophospholipid acyltransferase (LPLAT)-like uncharacterized protein
LSTEVSEPSPQKPLKLSHKLALAIGPRIIAIWLKILLLLNKSVIKGENRLDTYLDQDEPILAAVWHENAAMLIPKFAAKDIHALASHSRDGEIGARMLKCFGVDCVRGSSSKGGSEALSEMVKLAPNVKALGISIDGPRGPRRKSKPGIVVLSQRTGFSILCVAATATKTRRAKSWDRMCIPRPFGKWVYAIGDLIPPPVSDDRDAIDAKIREVEEAMDKLQNSIESEYGIDAQLTLHKNSED